MRTHSTAVQPFIEQVKDLRCAEQDVYNALTERQQFAWPNHIQGLFTNHVQHQQTHLKRLEQVLNLLNQSSLDTSQEFIQHQVYQALRDMGYHDEVEIGIPALLNALKELHTRLITYYSNVCNKANMMGYVVVADFLKNSRKEKEQLLEEISNEQGRVHSPRNGGMRITPTTTNR